MNELKFADESRLFSKAGQQDIAAKLANDVTEGSTSPIEAVVKMRAIYECAGKFLKDDAVRNAVIDEAEKYANGEDIQYHGAHVRIQETGAKYDFSGCMDPVWERLNAQIDELKAKRDERENMLKRISEALTLVDEDTGEVCTIYPAARTSKTNYVITFKK